MPPSTKSKKKEEFDFQEAEEHLFEVEQRYLDLMGRPGINVQYFFSVVLPPIRGAYNSGDRSEELAERIMSLE